MELQNENSRSVQVSPKGFLIVKKKRDAKVRAALSILVASSL